MPGVLLSREWLDKWCFWLPSKITRVFSSVELQGKDESCQIIWQNHFNPNVTFLKIWLEITLSCGNLTLLYSLGIINDGTILSLEVRCGFPQCLVLQRCVEFSEVDSLRIFYLPHRGYYRNSGSHVHFPNLSAELPTGLLACRLRAHHVQQGNQILHLLCGESRRGDSSDNGCDFQEAREMEIGNGIKEKVQRK